MSNSDRFKFRAFHKPTKKMFEVFCFTDKEVFENTIDGVGATPTNPANIDDCVLVQCTGLKDKNGRLIYEGDIVWTDEDGYGHIRWDNELAQFFVATEEYYTFDNIFPSEMEVVGNIHENPELLEGKK